MAENDVTDFRLKNIEGLLSEVRTDVKEMIRCSANYISRDEHKEMMRKYDSDFEMLKISKATLEGKASQFSVNVAYAISSVGILLGIITIILKFVKIG